jgi:hypothetical protein
LIELQRCIRVECQMLHIIQSRQQTHPCFIQIETNSLIRHDTGTHNKLSLRERLKIGRHCQLDDDRLAYGTRTTSKGEHVVTAQQYCQSKWSGGRQATGHVSGLTQSAPRRSETKVKLTRRVGNGLEVNAFHGKSQL